MTLPFVAQFDEESFTLMANKSFDPDIDPISITWFEKDRVLGNSAVLDVALAPGTHVITLVVRDTAGAESRDTATITITPYTGDRRPHSRDQAHPRGLDVHEGQHRRRRTSRGTRTPTRRSSPNRSPTR